MKIALLMLALGLAVQASAAPIATASHAGVIVTLTDEPCALPAVANLPNRATWQQDSKTYEGCFGVRAGLVLAYFDDRTVALLPLDGFIRATGVRFNKRIKQGA